MSTKSSSNPIEEELMRALKYGMGIDKDKLAELVKTATQLFEGVSQGVLGKANAEVGGVLSIYRWWIYGTPSLDRIGFQVSLGANQLQKFIDNINNIPEVRSALDRVELIPAGTASHPNPNPWIVAGSLGAKSEI